MALPINIEDLLNKRKIEGNRIEFKKGWNPADIYHSICAFANDFDNLGGGYILVGVEQHDNGLAKRPVAGINIEAVDGILKQMVEFNNMFDPYYLPRTSVEEEAIVNSMYHRSYEQYETVEISVEPEGIYILSFPGPDRSISKETIEEGVRLKSRRYRNRRLGDFLKELDLTEGRSTGISTIQEEMQKNGSPRATIETNDERSFINVFIPVHEGCGDKVILNDTKGDIQGGTQDGTQDGTQGVPQGELDVWIEEQIRKNQNITTEELAKLSKKGIRTIKRHISKLPNIRYVGRGYSGHWEVEEDNK